MPTASTTIIAWTRGRPALPDAARRSVGALARPLPTKPASSPNCRPPAAPPTAAFIAKICEQVVEFGPVNASIHKIDEHIDVAFIEPLKNVYRRVLEQLVA
jgi:succinyl-diaminopimelate desuccinylase